VQISFIYEEDGSLSRKYSRQLVGVLVPLNEEVIFLLSYFIVQ